MRWHCTTNSLLRCGPAAAAAPRAQGSEDTHVGAQGQVEIVRASRGDISGDSETDTLGLSASRALPTGGTLSLGAAGQRSNAAGFIVGADGMVTTNIVTRYATSLALRFVQPLLRGAGATAFEAPIRQAAQQRDAAQLTAEARAREVVVSISQAYWQAAFAWRQLEIRKASLEFAQKQLAYTEGAIRAEKVLRSEALAILAAIAVAARTSSPDLRALARAAPDRWPRDRPRRDLVPAPLPARIAAARPTTRLLAARP